MARPLRQDPDNGWHHVMNRGVDRMDIFRNDRDRRTFLGLTSQACAAAGVQVGAYCLMGNHYHLLLHCPEGGLPETMWKLGSEYVRIFNTRHGRDGPLFRSRYTSKLVTDDAYLSHLLGYIHANPASLGIDPMQWPWSSLRAAVGAGSPSLIDTSLVAPFVGDPASHVDYVMACAPPADVPEAPGPAAVLATWRRDQTLGQVRLVEELVELHGVGFDLRRRRAVSLLVLVELGATPGDLEGLPRMGSASALHNRLSRARALALRDPAFNSVVGLVRAKVALEAAA